MVHRIVKKSGAANPYSLYQVIYVLYIWHRSGYHYY